MFPQVTIRKLHLRQRTCSLSARPRTWPRYNGEHLVCSLDDIIRLKCDPFPPGEGSVGHDGDHVQRVLFAAFHVSQTSLKDEPHYFEVLLLCCLLLLFFDYWPCLTVMSLGLLPIICQFFQLVPRLNAFCFNFGFEQCAHLLINFLWSFLCPAECNPALISHSGITIDYLSINCL